MKRSMRLIGGGVVLAVMAGHGVAAADGARAGPSGPGVDVRQGTAAGPPGATAAQSARTGPPTCIYDAKGTTNAPPGVVRAATGGDGPPVAAVQGKPFKKTSKRRPPRVRTTLTRIACD